MRNTVCLISVMAIPLGVTAADETLKKKERVEDVVRYLKDAHREVYGAREAAKATFPAEAKSLWEHARKLHAELCGKAQSHEELSKVGQEVGDLENVTFKIMGILYGSDWYKQHYKNPSDVP